MGDLKSLFLIDSEIIFLNHGSFGATPRPVFSAYQAWQGRLENQPVLFLGRELEELLFSARSVLGKYLGADAEDLVFIPNSTFGVNIIARSLKLAEGDQILTSDHEYGACDNCWDYISAKTGVSYIHQSISLPIKDQEYILEEFWKGVGPRTKVIYLSMITSPTALRMPVEQICEQARNNGILTILDAAHAPGQIPVDLRNLGADMVFGNCHKWMLAPKGAGFLYVNKSAQKLIEPLIVSWGLSFPKERSTGSRFIDILQWTGTADPAAYLSVPSAIQFMAENNWDEVRLVCKHLLRIAIQEICGLSGMDPIYPMDSSFYTQMGIAPLPVVDPDLLKLRLYKEYKIEVPIIKWRDREFVRISVQGYNTRSEIEILIRALARLLPQVTI